MRVNEPISTREIELQEGRTLVSRTDLESKIVFVNQDFIEISGFTEAKLIGHPARHRQGQRR